MSNTIDKYIIMTFSIVNNPYPCYPYKFITENYSSMITIMSFWATAPKSPSENGIPKKILDSSLLSIQMMESWLKIGFWNINGILEEKMSDEVFKREIDKYDILFLCDTWLHRESINILSHPNGYLCNFALRNKRGKEDCPLGGGGSSLVQQ